MRSPSELPASIASATRHARVAQALRILRHYYDSDGRILQVRLGYCPEGRFSLQYPHADAAPRITDRCPG